MKTIITENLQNTQRYIPHTLETRLAAVKTYRNKNSISFICRRYKVSKASLMRWNKKYDGLKNHLWISLINHILNIQMHIPQKNWLGLKI